MRNNLENPLIYEPRMSGLRHTNVVMTLVSTLVIPPDGPTVWLADGGASDRVVRLPALQHDKQVVIANYGATNELNVTDANGVALIDIPPQAMGLFFAGTTRWVWISENFVSTTIAIIPTVVTGSHSGIG